MATTGQNFGLTGGTGTALSGSTVSTNPFVVAMDAISIEGASNAAGPSGSGVQTQTNNSLTILDRVLFDCAAASTTVRIGAKYYAPGMLIGGFAKNGVLVFTLTGTTAVNIDLTNLGNSIGASGFSQAGDTSLATWNMAIFRNISNLTGVTSTLTITTGASNPAPFPNALSGTTPGFALLAGDCMPMYAVVGKTIDSTHKVITVTPTAAGVFALVYGGA